MRRLRGLLYRRHIVYSRLNVGVVILIVPRPWAYLLRLNETIDLAFIPTAITDGTLITNAADGTDVSIYEVWIRRDVLVHHAKMLVDANTRDDAVGVMRLIGGKRLK